MPIFRASTPEGLPVQNGMSFEEFESEDYIAKLILREQTQQLEVNREYDITPETWRNCMYASVYVEKDDFATLRVWSPLENPELDGHEVAIYPDQNMAIVQLENPDGSNNRIVETVFYLQDGVEIDAIFTETS